MSQTTSPQNCQRFFRVVLALALVTLAWHSPAHAAPVQLFDSPSHYAPGNEFSLSIRLPTVSNLSSYQIDVLLQSDQGIAGTDYFFSGAIAATPESGYVFSSTEFFGTGSDLEGSQLQRLSISDLDLGGRDVTVGVNDQIATISILTSAAFRGDLSLSIDANTLILDDTSLTPTPVEEFDAIASATFAQSPTIVSAIPEPSTLMPLLLGAISCSLVGFRRTRS